MRVVILTTLIYDNPTVRSIVTGLGAAYRAAGHEVAAAGRFGPWLGKPGKPRERAAFGEVRRLGRGAKDPMGQARSARKDLAELCAGADLVHLMIVGRYDPLLEEYLYAARKAKALATFQDFGNPPCAAKEAKLLDGFIRRCSAVTALSRAQAKEISAVLPSARGRIKVVPNGCALPAKAPAKRAARPYLVCASRQLPYKGIDVLILAWKDALAAGVEADLLLCGADYGNPHYRNLSAALGLERRTRFLGEVGRAKLDGLMRGCEALVLPSRHEAFGMAALEAMALGKPVIATRSGGPEDFVADGRNGLLVPPGDARKLAAAICSLLGSSSRRKALGARAARDAKEYAWPRIAERYLALAGRP